VKRREFITLLGSGAEGKTAHCIGGAPPGQEAISSAGLE